MGPSLVPGLHLLCVLAAFTCKYRELSEPLLVLCLIYPLELALSFHQFHRHLNSEAEANLLICDELLLKMLLLDISPYELLLIKSL